MQQEPARASRQNTLIAVVILGASGVAFAVFLYGSFRSGSRAVPTVVIGGKLQAAGAKFGRWEKAYPGYDGTVELPAGDGGGIRTDEITVECEGPGGLKLKRGHSSHPAVRPGEKGRISIFTSDAETVRITLDLP